MLNTVYIIAGPTAVGKSTVAYYLAKRINGEIINCDSVQLYKYMDIGSAKPEPNKINTVKHHLYGIVEPGYNMSVAKYQRLAFAVIDNVLRRGKVPIVVGGTGLYLNSILYDMNFATSPIDEKRRRELEKLAYERGNEYVHQLLSAIDPASAERIHPNNLRKVIRAIEAYENGSKITSLNECKPNTKYNFKFYGLTMDRKWLYERINKRVIKLIKHGLVEEVQSLMKMGYDADTPSMNGIGYKEIITYENGEVPLKDTVTAIMRNTRHYAKRQITWLKRYDQINWIEIKRGETVGEVIDEILSYSSHDKSSMSHNCD